MIVTTAFEESKNVGPDIGAGELKEAVMKHAREEPAQVRDDGLAKPRLNET